MPPGRRRDRTGRLVETARDTEVAGAATAVLVAADWARVDDAAAAAGQVDACDADGAVCQCEEESEAASEIIECGRRDFDLATRGVAEQQQRVLALRESASMFAATAGHRP